MASCERKTVFREVTTRVAEPVYVLNLTQQEAETISILFGRIGGSPEGRRGDINRIADVLRAAGVPSQHFSTSSAHFGGPHDQSLYLNTAVSPIDPIGAGNGVS